MSVYSWSTFVVQCATCRVCLDICENVWIVCIIACIVLEQLFPKLSRRTESFKYVIRSNLSINPFAWTRVRVWVIKRSTTSMPYHLHQSPLTRNYSMRNIQRWCVLLGCHMYHDHSIAAQQHHFRCTGLVNLKWWIVNCWNRHAKW